MTSPSPRAAFEFEGATIRLDKLLPSRAFADQLKQTVKYRALLASVREVGIVEPLSVYRQKGGKYLILDGHARAEALRDLGVAEAPCLIATDDEGYTYNNKVNRIAPIQANRMILKALEAGVPEERIAKALNLSAQTVRGNRHLPSAPRRSRFYGTSISRRPRSPFSRRSSQSARSRSPRSWSQPAPTPRRTRGRW
jgi:ParB-like chromosome segregation protein Spo0J